MNKKTKELNRLNNELDKRVSAESQEAFTDMICYLRGANISEYHQETVRQDLLEMILSAQERGENIQSVVKGDYKAFCDDIIASLPARSRKEKVLEFFDIVCWCLSILGLINIVIANETIALIRNFAAGNPMSFEISVSSGSVISAGIIITVACVIVETLLKKSFNIRKKKDVSIGEAFFIGASIMAVFLFIAWLGKTPLFTVNIFIALAVVAILYIAHKVLSHLA